MTSLYSESETGSARQPSVPGRPILSLKPKSPIAAEASITALAGEPVQGRAYSPRKAAKAQAIRAVCFVDGQNLHWSALEAFGCDQYVNPLALAKAMCAQQGWRCDAVYYYQGAPDPDRQPDESRLWSHRRYQLQLDGVVVFDRRLQYLERQHQTPDGSLQTRLRVKEKGVDVRMALDVIELALDGTFDVAVLFCRDQDLSEVVPSLDRLSKRQHRPIRVASAFPEHQSGNFRGIYGTQWLHIDKAIYEACLPQSGYRAALTAVGANDET